MCQVCIIAFLFVVVCVDFFHVKWFLIGSLPRKYHVAELISRVRNSLPPYKVQELSYLLNGLKVGMLPLISNSMVVHIFVFVYYCSYGRN